MVILLAVTEVESPAPNLLVLAFAAPIGLFNCIFVDFA